MSEPDVVERLRKIARRYEVIVLNVGDDKSLADHMREAADEITRLRSQNATMREALNEAVTIFEKTAEALGGLGQHGLAITILGDAKRARAALASTDAAGEETK